jgi:ABC-type uncharacterized transport system ATPase subunit
LGLGIKMQIPCIFQDLTVAQNIVLARLASRRSSRQVDVLHLVGLQGRDDEVASTLAHGEQQWLEMAMLLAQDPSVVLLDEPGAGMGNDDKLRTLELIHRLAEDHTIVVVEHDMEFIRRLEAPVFVLHKGVVFKSGTFAEILADEEVIDVYLGRKSHAVG